jgi:hypothetical protein
MKRLIEWIVARLPHRLILGDDGTPYLSRYYIRGGHEMPDGSCPYDEHGDPRPDAIARSGLGVYLHRFHREDRDRELHNHPWRWSFSIILRGAYHEERQEGAAGAIELRTLRAGALNWLWNDSFHRVDLLTRDVWTLFVTGPKVQSWGFLDRATKEVIPWRESGRRRAARENSEIRRRHVMEYAALLVRENRVDPSGGDAIERKVAP